MASERSIPDANWKAAGVVAGYAHTDAVGAASPTIVVLRVNSTTGRLLVDSNLAQSEDAVHASGDTGVMSLAVRQDSQVDFGADGDYVPFSVDASGALRVTGGGGGTQYAEDAVHTSGDTGTMALAVRNDAGAAQAADGDYHPLLVNSSGALYVTGGGGGTEYTEGDTDATITGSAIMWEDAADTLRAVSSAKPLPVDGSGVTQPVSGTFWQVTQPVSIAATVTVDLGGNNDVSLNTGTNAIGRVGHNITGIAHGVKTITTAGTDEVLASSTACKRITIQSQTDNTGLIAVGASGVDATEATGNGIILYAGDTYEIETDNLADIYIDSTVNGEGVRYTYFT